MIEKPLEGCWSCEGIVIEDHAYRLVVYPAGWAVDDDLVDWMDDYLAANPPRGLGDTAGIGGLFASDTSPSSRSPVTERLPEVCAASAFGRTRSAPAATSRSARGRPG